MASSAAADDVIKRLTSMSSARLEFEWAWRQVQKVAATDASDFNAGLGSGISSGLLSNSPTATRRSKEIYDSTAVWGVDRLSSGLEALIIPQSEYWHNLTVTDLRRRAWQLGDDDKLYLEDLRNLMFEERYDADTGWITATQTCIRRLVAFGNAFMFVEDGDAGRSLVKYRYIPLSECYAAENSQGRIDTFYRYYSLTARQAVQKFGAQKVSPKLRRAAENPNDMDRPFMFVQAIAPRGDYGMPSEGVMRAPYASLHIEHESRLVVGESGFFEFPIIDFRWLPEPGKVYGEGPVMRCLADIQSLNLMAKNELVASQQAVDPPLLTANAGVMNRPNTNPGQVNVGGLSPTGEPLVKPLFSGQRLDFATLVLEAKRNQVKESLYINLFALLVQEPQMTATQALIRANEKGELLGPAGSRIQQSLSNLVVRELGLLERHGLYRRDSAYALPRSLREASIGPQMSGPLSRLRRAGEAEGTVNLLNILSPLAQVDPTVVDAIDPDETVRGLAEVLGVPVRFMRTRDAVKAMRDQRDQQNQLAQGAVIAKDMASAGKQGVEAMMAMAGG